VFAVVVATAGCSGGTAEKAATTTLVSQPRGQSQVVIANVPSTGVRLAFADEDSLFILSESSKPVRVGPAGRPVWSRDGRYVAWTVREYSRSSDSIDLDDINAPESHALWILDTTSGVRVAFQQPDVDLQGDLLATRDGFAAPMSGANNLGKGSVHFVLVNFDDLVAGRDATIVHAAFEDPLHYDFNWIEGRGDVMYVVRTEASTLWYRYNPDIWRVTLDGSVRRLFGECDGAEPQCSNNAGMWPISLSPSGTHVAFSGGGRDGCETHDTLVVSPTQTFKPTAFHGLPASAHDGVELRVHGLSWVSEDTFFVAIGTLEYVSRCDDVDVRSPTIHRCSIDGTCQDLGVLAYSVAAHRSGAVARRSRFTDRYVDDFLVTWADGSETSILTTDQTLAWSP
jgi:hypothetical protein